MRKLKLDLDDLTVESFDTENTPAARGTVVGHGPTLSGPCNTCYLSCNYTACQWDCPSEACSE